MTENVELQQLDKPARTPLQESWRILRRNRLAMIGMVLFAAFFLVAIFGAILTHEWNPQKGALMNPSIIRLADKLRPPFAKYNAAEMPKDDREKARPPFGVYVLGTDSLGRDVLSRMLQGAWVSLTVGFVAVGISVAVGVVLGGLAGYFGKWPDILIMRLVDIMLCIPRFILILTILALWGPGLFRIMIIVGLTSWMGTTRFVRAEFLSLREQDFVTAAHALGGSSLRIIFRHMLPNALAPVLVSATIGIAGTILLEAGLSFLGFGVPPPNATWGKILASGREYLFDAPWLTYIPGIAILIVVLSFNLFGEGLRDALNPKLRGRVS